MKSIRRSTQFKKDYKRVKRQKYSRTETSD
jgi:mRNA-degrading endonuclease YafQ of YafQ-DinJ toxin-antitoxin module